MHGMRREREGERQRKKEKEGEKEEKRKREEFQVRVLTISSFVILGKSLNNSELHFPHLSNELL